MDDDLPRARPALVNCPPLDRLGVAELQAYVVGLQAEIARAEGEIGRKRAVAEAAQGFFRSPAS